MVHSARETDSPFCFLALKETDYTQMGDGFLKIRKQKLNRHAPTLWQGKIFLFCASPSLSCQVNTLPAKEIYSLHKDKNMEIFTSGFRGRQYEWSNPDLKNLIMVRLQIHVFPLPLKKKEYICISWKVVPESCCQYFSSSTVTNKPKPWWGECGIAPGHGSAEKASSRLLLPELSAAVLWG